jgi:hypothetical protein
MDQRDDYGELGPLSPGMDPRWWYEVARNLVLAVGLVVLALMFAGALLVKVVEIRGKPKGPPADSTDPADERAP